MHTDHRAGRERVSGSGVSIIVADGGRILAEGTETQGIRFSSPPGSNAQLGRHHDRGLRRLARDAPGLRVLRRQRRDLHRGVRRHAVPRPRHLWHDDAPVPLARLSFVSHQPLPFPGRHGVVRSAPRHRRHQGRWPRHRAALLLRHAHRLQRRHGLHRRQPREQNQPILQVYNNVFAGSGDDLLDLDGTDAWIEGNIFLHAHRNGSPDSSAAISGGSEQYRTSEITILGNLFFDCDNVATAKQGNFFTLLNNTIVRTTKKGGLDFASGVVCVRDTTPSLTTFAKGFYLEGNIIVDAEQLVRNYDAKQTTVTFNNNILPMPWTGPGSGNSVLDPMLKHIPQVSETQFTTWEQAQVMRDWFSLQPGSPARGTGPNGSRQGRRDPARRLDLRRAARHHQLTTATFVVGVNRTGSGIPTAGFPLGSGFTHYRWRLDGTAWSEETPIDFAHELTDLAPGAAPRGSHRQERCRLVSERPRAGRDAVVTMSRTWTVDPSYRRLVINEVLAVNDSP